MQKKRLRQPSLDMFFAKKKVPLENAQKKSKYEAKLIA